jgi:hypothetical protein
MAKNEKIKNGHTKDESNLRFETTNNQNVVKAISYSVDGKEQETFLYVMTEEQFESLIPQSEKKHEVVFH